MRHALRACMVALVVVNLAFVHITDAARWIWLGPLVALTLFSPYLLRFTRFIAYRLAWNLAVLGAFALLVRHVTYAGAAFLLEDGLLLAALCQVHLVNNLSDSQKPDLLFFNSFLIAVVTSYLSVDLGYSLVLLAYAPLLVVAMQLLGLVRSGAVETPGLVGRAVRSGLARGAIVLAATMVLFFVVPRDFNRRGLLGETLRLAPPGTLSEVAFSESVDLSQSGQVQVSDRVVMTVRPREGRSPPAHWRGATLDRFDGQGWRSARGVFAARPWVSTGVGRWERLLPEGGGDCEVYLADPDSPRLFAPLDSRRLELASPDLEVAPLPDGNFRRVPDGRRRPIQYAVEIAAVRSQPGGRPRPVSRALRTHALVDPRNVPPRARELARELRLQLPSDAPQHEIVERFRSDLAARFRYLAPGTEGGARTLAEFLGGEAGAHCEYFATALAVMLRSELIPCRVVTGYRSEEWDSERGTLTIRARHAHAWVEVLDPEAGWYTVDPTPAIGASSPGNPGLLASVERFASDLWATIAGFNTPGRDKAVAWLRGLPRAIADRSGEFLLATLALALLLAAAHVHRRRREQPQIRAYVRLLRKLRLDLAAGETPRELLARARRTAFPAEGLAKLEQVTEAHERARYAAL